MAATNDDMNTRLLSEKTQEEEKHQSPFDKFLSYATPATGAAKGGFFTVVLGIVFNMRALFQISRLHYFLLPIAPVLELLEFLWDSIELYKAPKKTTEKILSVIFNFFKFLAVTAAVTLIIGFAATLGAVAGLAGGIIFTAVTGVGAIFQIGFAISKSIKVYLRNREAIKKENEAKRDDANANQLRTDAIALREEAKQLKNEIKYHIFGGVFLSVMAPLIALVFIKGMFAAAIAGSVTAGVGAIIGASMFIYDRFFKKPDATVQNVTSDKEKTEEREPEPDNDLDLRQTPAPPKMASQPQTGLATGPSATQSVAVLGASTSSAPTDSLENADELTSGTPALFTEVLKTMPRAHAGKSEEVYQKGRDIHRVSHALTMPAVQDIDLSDRQIASPAA